MKPLTIPKLELHADDSSGRLRGEIRLTLTLPVERTIMWTDSTTLLQWLQTTEKLPVFVANRLAEILELTTTDEWNYARTTENENPADAGIRGLSANALSENHWLKGSDFLNRQRTFCKKLERTVLNPTISHQDPKTNSNGSFLP